MTTDISAIPIIDADTHIIEPPDLWTSRVSVEKWGDRVPHVKWDEESQEELWYFCQHLAGSTSPGLASGARWHEHPPTIRTV